MRTILIVATALLASACGSAHGDAGPQATRQFAAAGFSQVALKGSDNVIVKIGPQFSVSASGQQSVLDQLDIHVDGDTLKVSRKAREGWHIAWSRGGYRGAIITVTMPAISAATLAGSGDMTVNAADAASFNASLTGSGDLAILKAKLGNLSVDMAGSGDVKLDGTAQQAKITLAGSGNVAATGLNSVDADVSLAGSGDVNLRATGQVKISLMGSGDIVIAGTNRCAISKMGSGDARCTL